jgi:hypothetical protein
MTYIKIYNQLNKNGLIEKILTMTNFDKIGLIEGIKYLESFLNSSTFENMQYWKDRNCNNTIAIVCREYSLLQIENNKKHIQKFEYLANVMK